MGSAGRDLGQAAFHVSSMTTGALGLIVIGGGERVGTHVMG